MSQIKIVSSMAFDAICFFEYLVTESDMNNDVFLPKRKEFREKIEKLTSANLKDGFLGMSTLCGRLTSYDKTNEFENYTLDDLLDFFKNPENIREALEKEEIWASDKLSPEEWSEKYLNYLNILKEIKFDELWESDLLPIIQEEIEKRQKICENLNMDGAFKDIQKLKQCEPLKAVKIYISVMSFPIAFKLYGNSFLDSMYGNMGIGIVCHELMHGFSNTELEKLYLDYIKNDKYLTVQHDRLINEWRSSNEEEFVVAADCYLRMNHNGEMKEALLKQTRNQYNGCMPTAVFLFDLLAKEQEIPNNYAQWLIDVFKNKKLPQEDIEKHLEDIIKIN